MKTEHNFVVVDAVADRENFTGVTLEEKRALARAYLEARGKNILTNSKFKPGWGWKLPAPQL